MVGLLTNQSEVQLPIVTKRQTLAAEDGEKEKNIFIPKQNNLGQWGTLCLKAHLSLPNSSKTQLLPMRPKPKAVPRIPARF